MATSNNSGYALELIVGVKDAFTQQSKKIENESKKLEREFKQLQKTTTDIDAFKKAENALKELNQQETKNKKAITAQERELERLGRTLKNTGVDVNNIAQEERRLQAEIQKTNQGLKQQGSALQNIEKIGTIAGGAMASAGLAWAGNDKSRNERLLAARSSYSLEEVQSASQRQFRTDLIRMYGADQESIFAAQALAKQQNLGEEDTQALTKATIQLQKIFPDYSSPETVRALPTFQKALASVLRKRRINSTPPAQWLVMPTGIYSIPLRSIHRYLVTKYRLISLQLPSFERVKLAFGTLIRLETHSKSHSWLVSVIRMSLPSWLVKVTKQEQLMRLRM